MCIVNADLKKIYIYIFNKTHIPNNEFGRKPTDIQTNPDR